MWISSVIVDVVCAFILSLGLSLIEYLWDLSKAVFFFVAIVVGSGGIVLALMPIFFGAVAAVNLAEKVCPSKRGTRYKFFGILSILYGICNIIMGFVFSTFYPACIWCIIYGIFVIIYGKETV